MKWCHLVATGFRAVSVRIPFQRGPAATVGRVLVASLMMQWLTLSYTRRMIVGMETQRTRTVAYLRVSTDKQAERGVSLDAQRAKVLAYA